MSLYRKHWINWRQKKKPWTEGRKGCWLKRISVFSLRYFYACHRPIAVPIAPLWDVRGRKRNRRKTSKPRGEAKDVVRQPAEFPLSLAPLLLPPISSSPPPVALRGSSERDRPRVHGQLSCNTSTHVAAAHPWSKRIPGLFRTRQ